MDLQGLGFGVVRFRFWGYRGLGLRLRALMLIKGLGFWWV